MNERSQLDALLDLAEEFGLPVRTMPGAAETGEHPGGAVVRLKGKEVVFLDPSAALADQAAVLASALRGRKELADRFLPPEIRQLLEEP